MTKISIPKLSLVVLIGPSGSGKSTFARKHFLATEVLSSDACRAMLTDDETDQSITKDAFELLHAIAARRLRLGRLTVIDATNVQPEARRPLVALAREFHCLPVAIVLNVPEKVCAERNRSRANRPFGAHVVPQQLAQLRRGLRRLAREGFRSVFVLESAADIDAATIERVPLWNDRRDDHGPFDIIGDVHGCRHELETLLTRLGYAPVVAEMPDPVWGEKAYVHSEGRKALFVGDLVDRGPQTVECLRLVHNMVARGAALCVPGNHDIKLLRKLQGRDVQITHGLAETLAEIAALPAHVQAPFRAQLVRFLDGLISHYVLDDGKLVVAHAGLKAEMQGRGSAKVRDFALYGETTGETDDFGLPVRFNWAQEYRGTALVVYGHTPVPEPDWLNHTVNIDTGCVFGGKLTALRYPEKELVSVAAERTYCEPRRPFLTQMGQAAGLSAQQLDDDVLHAEDVLGKRAIVTRLRGNVTIREANATAALEVMSRFAANPKWLIYLPPTMSPGETSTQADLLEHPAEAFAYFRSQGVAQVICEEKHMGSRAVVIVCQDEEAARTRFGVNTGEIGIVYTRTGRRFFDDPAFEQQFLARVRAALTAAGTWTNLRTNWVCLDCELMPWSAKAQELLKAQYAAVGAAGRATLPCASSALAQTVARLDSDEKLKAERLLQTQQMRTEDIERFVAAYRGYCWPVTTLTDLKLAPFHLLATQGGVHTDKNHLWHMGMLRAVCEADPELLLPTQHHLVDVTDPGNEAGGCDWWQELTQRGGEGMVVKPVDFVVRGRRGLVQPALKCRGREYLRIIYGPDYTDEGNLARLRSRRLAYKRSLALSEFALGVEGLERFVRSEPLRRVHECVFGVLALESEPVDPRL